MSRGAYTVYHYDTETRKTGDAIGVKGLPINRADEIARTHCQKIAGSHKTKWKRVPAGENCKFMIEGRRTGFIVIKDGIGPDYKKALQSKTKKVAL